MNMALAGNLFHDGYAHEAAYGADLPARPAGREIARRLGYPEIDLQRCSADVIDNFSGVGYFFDLLALRAGQTVVDLGCPVCLDGDIASRQVGDGGRVLGIESDFTRLGAGNGRRNFKYQGGELSATGLADASVDAVIANGSLRHIENKSQVFREAFRVLKSGAKFAVADFVRDFHAPRGLDNQQLCRDAGITNCMELGDYIELMEDAGFQVQVIRENRQYEFFPPELNKIARESGIKSVSLLAFKP